MGSPIAPFFSVIIPVYNKGAYLRASVESVFSQRFDNFELLLVLDPSTDNSEEIAQSFTDTRIKIFKRNEPGPGGYAARNLGISQATAPWVAFLDADDTWNNNFLSLAAKAINQNPNTNVFCSAYSIEQDGAVVNDKYYRKYSGSGDHSFSFEKFLLDKPIWTSALIVKKESIITSGNFPEGKYLRGGDQETWF